MKQPKPCTDPKAAFSFLDFSSRFLPEGGKQL
jgi:hypothetical protein